MTDEQIEKIALANGFKLKEQPDGSMALNPYVFEFARALVEPMKELAEGRDELAAREASAKSLMNRLIDAPAYHGGPRPATVQEFIDWALGGIDYLAARDARMKAEALEEVTSHNISRLAKSIGLDAWEMNPVGICKLVNRSAAKYRKQAEDAIARNYPNLSITDEVTEWTPRHQKAAEDLQLRKKVAVACDHIEGAEFVAWLNSVGYDAKLSDDYHDYVGGKDTAVYDEANEKMRDLWNRYCDEA